MVVLIQNLYFFFFICKKFFFLIKVYKFLLECNFALRTNLDHVSSKTDSRVLFLRTRPGSGPRDRCTILPAWSAGHRRRPVLQCRPRAWFRPIRAHTEHPWAALLLRREHRSRYPNSSLSSSVSDWFSVWRTMLMIGHPFNSRSSTPT